MWQVAGKEVQRDGRPAESIGVEKIARRSQQLPCTSRSLADAHCSSAVQ